MNKFLVLIVILIMSLPFANAISGSIGNAKMILRDDVGVEIERSILVINDNDVAVDIILEVSDELKDIVVLDEEGFRLGANERKDAGFKIKAVEEGLYDGRIVVKFKPEEGNGIALASNVILITSGYVGGGKEDDDKEDDKEEDDKEDDKDEDTDEELEDEEEDDTDDVIGLEDEEDEEEKDNGNSVTGESVKESKANPLIGVLIATSLILIGLIVAVLFLIKGGDIKKGGKKSKK